MVRDIRRQYADPAGPEADRAVRETLVQMEFAFAAPDKPFASPLVPPSARKRAPLRAAWERLRRIRSGQWERRRAKLEAVARRWDAENLAALLGGRPDASAGFLNPMAESTERFNSGIELGGGKDALWIDGVLVLDEKGAVKIETPRDVARLMLPLRSPNHESFRVVALDARNKVLGARVVTVGTLDSCPVDMRTIFGWLPEKTRAIVVAHNHPPEDPRPRRPTSG